jgi:hypothetical protein
MEVVIRPIYLVKSPGGEEKLFYHWTTGNVVFDKRLDNDFTRDTFELKSLLSYHGSRYRYVPGSYSYEPVNDLITMKLERRDGRKMTDEDAKEVEKIILDSSFVPASYSHWEMSTERKTAREVIREELKLINRKGEYIKCLDDICEKVEFSLGFEFLTAKE